MMAASGVASAMLPLIVPRYKSEENLEWCLSSTAVRIGAKRSYDIEFAGSRFLRNSFR